MSRLIIVLLSWMMMSSAHAIITIEVSKGAAGALPIAVVPFESSASNQDIASIINSDLQRSGKFGAVELAEMPEYPGFNQPVEFAKWQAKNIEYLVLGRLNELDERRFEVEFELLGIFKPVLSGNDGSNVRNQAILIQARFPVLKDQLRNAAHYIADKIYEELIGVPGAFSTRISFVRYHAKAALPYELVIADSDGYNEQLIAESKEPIMSPAWSPDGRRLAYVSFETGNSAIYIRDIYSEHLEKVTAFDGINSAPKWSPDGKKLALTLSKDGNPEVYVLDLNTRKLQRLTQHWAIDTEPCWMPDGQSLIFTSDRGGKPQIYQVAFDGLPPQRLTYEGRYNAGASVTSDGKKMVMVHQNDSAFHIAIQDLTTGEMRILTDTRLDESPSLAPNDSMILYATLEYGRKILATVSFDGRFSMRLPDQSGAIRAPAWSPFLNNNE